MQERPYPDDGQYICEQHLGYLDRRWKDCMKTRHQLLMPSAEQVRSSISVLHEGGTLSSGLTSQMQMRNFMRATPNLGTRLRDLSDKNTFAKRSAAQRPGVGL